MKCDKQRISQVIVNLLSNALKFTFEGYIKIQVDATQKIKVKKQNSSRPLQLLNKAPMDLSNHDRTYFELPSADYSTL